MSKKGFTLAEVLVTLGLIGVVAAITIPYFLNEFNKDKWTITYKRSFAETYNTLAKMALEEDCAKSLTCTHLFDNGQIDSTKAFGDSMTKQLAIAKNCGTTAGDCFSHDIRIGLSKNETQTLKETMSDKVAFAEGQDFESGFYTFVTTRGVSYALLSFGLNCLNTPNSNAEAAQNEQYLNAYVTDSCKTGAQKDCQMLSLCGFIVLDVNGKQLPNTWGRDVFGMWVTDRSVLGVYPFGGEGDKAFGGACHFATDAESDTRGCAAQLIKDGWKMKY